MDCDDGLISSNDDLPPPTQPLTEKTSLKYDENTAALIIQKRWRGYAAKRYRIKLLAAIIIFQKFYRSLKAKRLFKQLLEESRWQRDIPPPSTPKVNVVKRPRGVAGRKRPTRGVKVESKEVIDSTPVTNDGDDDDSTSGVTDDESSKQTVAQPKLVNMGNNMMALKFDPTSVALKSRGTPPPKERPVSISNPEMLFKLKKTGAIGAGGEDNDNPLSHSNSVGDSPQSFSPINLRKTLLKGGSSLSLSTPSSPLGQRRENDPSLGLPPPPMGLSSSLGLPPPLSFSGSFPPPPPNDQLPPPIFGLPPKIPSMDIPPPIMANNLPPPPTPTTFKNTPNVSSLPPPPTSSPSLKPSTPPILGLPPKIPSMDIPPPIMANNLPPPPTSSPSLKPPPTLGLPPKMPSLMNIPSPSMLNIPPPPNQSANNNLPPLPSMAISSNLPPPPTTPSSTNLPPPPTPSSFKTSPINVSSLPPPPNQSANNNLPPPPVTFNNKNKSNGSKLNLLKRDGDVNSNSSVNNNEPVFGSPPPIPPVYKTPSNIPIPMVLPGLKKPASSNNTNNLPPPPMMGVGVNNIPPPIANLPPPPVANNLPPPPTNINNLPPIPSSVMNIPPVNSLPPIPSFNIPPKVNNNPTNLPPPPMMGNIPPPIIGNNLPPPPTFNIPSQPKVNNNLPPPPMLGNIPPPITGNNLPPPPTFNIPPQLKVNNNLPNNLPPPMLGNIPPPMMNNIPPLNKSVSVPTLPIPAVAKPNNINQSTSTSSRQLKPGWREYTTPEGKKYYHNRDENRTVWDPSEACEPIVLPPPPTVPTSNLPPPPVSADFWIEYTTAEGKTYYHNRTTNTTVWTKPVGVEIHQPKQSPTQQQQQQTMPQVQSNENIVTMHKDEKKRVGGVLSKFLKKRPNKQELETKNILSNSPSSEQLASTSSSSSSKKKGKK